MRQEENHAKAGRSYTVCFGALEISVNTAQQENTEEHIPITAPPVRPSACDSILGKQLLKARKRDADKRVVKDEAYWDQRHANAEHGNNIVHESRHTTALCSMLFQNSRDQKTNNEFTLLPPAVQSVLETNAQRNGRECAVNLRTDDSGPGGVNIRDFFVCQQSNEVPVNCWACVQELVSFPKFMPFKYQQKTGYFMVCGYFCSWECARLHAMSLGGTLHHAALLGHMLQLLFGYHVRIRPHCHRLALKVFGGHVEIRDFRSAFHQCNNQDIGHRLLWHPSVPNCVRISK